MDQDFVRAMFGPFALPPPRPHFWSLRSSNSDPIAIARRTLRCLLSGSRQSLVMSNANTAILRQTSKIVMNVVVRRLFNIYAAADKDVHFVAVVTTALLLVCHIKLRCLAHMCAHSLLL